ncbi:hypothetical protein [Planomicrobium sp. YIM 101495]|uniref:hypothetical protein n=1 Tax=Planomicrobium sp. YIM 101495 TaxID=2665160 RepID=UPI0012B8CE59|nr:hypothetical protein [Planomicrobium sp. YIM 101495]MTD31081.1 hypothetical protein [Planomicrobium sp. YIM 101495]
MARNSGGMIGKLALLGIGVAIGTAMSQKKVDSNGQAQGSNFKENLTKGLDSLNEQTGGMVDKVKPGVTKAMDKVKDVIDNQQKMMSKERDMIDDAQDAMNKTDSGSGSSSSNSKSGSTGSAGSNSSEVAPDTDKPSAGIYGGSTEYTESLKKNLSDDASSDKTFDK